MATTSIPTLYLETIPGPSLQLPGTIKVPTAPGSRVSGGWVERLVLPGEGGSQQDSQGTMVPLSLLPELLQE